MQGGTRSRRSGGILWGCVAAGRDVLDGLNVARAAVELGVSGKGTGCIGWPEASSSRCTCGTTTCY